MTELNSVEVTFVDNADDITLLVADLESSPDEVDIVATDREADPSSYGLTTIEIAAIVTIIQFGFYTAGLAAKIYAYLAAKKRGGTLIVKTPLDETRFTSREKLSKEDIAKRLESMLPVRR